MALESEPSLTAMRWLLFLFFGGVGSLLPFLSLHARAIGLSLAEARLVSIISPLIAFVGPTVAGPLIDFISTKKRGSSEDGGLEKSRCIRVTLTVTILLATIFYSLLLTVPTAIKLDPEQPAVSFVCDEHGASLVQSLCKDQQDCYEYLHEKLGTIRLTSCQFDCTTFSSDLFSIDAALEESVTPSTSTSTTTTTVSSANVVETTMSEYFNLGLEPDEFFKSSENDDEDGDDYERELGSGSPPVSNWLHNRRRRDSLEYDREPSPPHICYGSPSKRMCNVFTPYSTEVFVNITVRQARNYEELCVYPLGSSFACRIPGDLEKPRDSCQVKCDVTDPFADRSVLQPSQCPLTVGNAELTFWLYLTYRSFGDLFAAVTISILISATLTAVRLQIGREFLLPTVAYALFASLMGYLQSPHMTPLLLDNIPPYSLSITVFDILSLCSVLVLLFATQMVIGPPDWWSSSRSVVMRHKAEFGGVLLVLTLLGMLWGPHFSQVPWHITAEVGLDLYVGTSLSVGALLSLPFVWKADVVTDYCGYSNLLITSFTFYILRYTGLLFIKSPWVLLMTGGMEVFTLSLMTFSAILYIRHLVPRHLTFTAQSLGFAAHFCLGNGLGCLLATVLSPSEEQTTLPSSNSTNADSAVFQEETDGPYHLLYCVEAVFSAVTATVYFFVYHCCFKKKCLAPPHRKPASSPPLVQDSTVNGTYTPLRVFHNGRQPHQPSD